MTDSSKPTLLVVDGHSLAFRAFFALPVDNFSTADGQHTNAIHGFLSMFVNLLRDEDPTHVAVAFDVSRESFRTREYSDYKATRAATPPEFAGQIPLLKECLGAMGVTVIEKPDFEADDILATLSTRASGDDWSVLVCSGDRDSIQLVNDEVTLLYPSVQGVSKLKRYDPAAVEEKYGLPPHMYPDIAALVGETSDNLPGVPKVGEKTAVKWLTKYGSLDALLEHADEITGVVGNNLREHLDDVRRNRRLNALRRDVELPIDLAELIRQPADETALREIFARLEFRALMSRVLQVTGSSGDADAEPSTPVPTVSRTEAQDVAQWLAAMSGEVAVEVEVIDGRPSRIGFARAGELALVDWSDTASAHLAEWFTSDAPKLLADAKPQVKALARTAVTFSGLAFDVVLAGWLARPSFPDKTLAHLVDTYLQEKLPEADPGQLVPETLGADPAQRAWFVERVTSELREALAPRLLSVLTDIELPTLLALAAMELAGVAIAKDELEAFSTELGERAASIAQDAYATIGHEVNLGSPKQLQEVLFTELELPKTRKTKTGYTTDAAALADLQEQADHPFLRQLLSHREATKLKQIIDGLSASIQSDGRVHTTYVQTASQTGRLSSNDPNLQNIPVRTEESRRIRSAFVTGEGYETLLTADYSQIEMRIMAHLSKDAGLVEAFNNGEDLHRFVGARVFGVEPSDVSSTMRSKVKAMSYGLVYGLSAFGLSKQLRIPQAEAKSLMLEYFTRFGAVRDYLRASVEQARVDGYTETIFGRRRLFPDLGSPNRQLRENAERAALNAPIQGSAADIMKIALVDVHNDLLDYDSRLLLQIHDEIVVEVAPGEGDAVAEIVERRMAGAADLSVPLDVQIGRGDNWNLAAH